MGIGTAGLSTGLGLYQTIEGAKEQNNARNAMENYQRQTLENVYKNAQVSTLGADLQREEQARLVSSQVNALQGAGTRALVGGLGRVETGNQMVNQKIGANLDEQQKAIDQMTAEDQARIRAMQEAREQGDINALSSQYQSGKQDMNMGLGNIVQGFGSMGNQMNFNRALDLQKQNGQTPTATKAPIIIPNQGMSSVDERYAPTTNNTINPNAFNIGGRGMFNVPMMGSTGYGTTPVGYDASGQPMYNPIYNFNK